MVASVASSHFSLRSKRRTRRLWSAKSASSRWRPVVATASLVVAATLVPATAAEAATAEAAATTARLTVTRLSVTRGGTWGDDLVTIKGSGFSGAGGRSVSAVMFGAYQADGFDVVNATTITAFSPEVPNTPTKTDIRVVLRDNTVSPRTPADVFTFVIPTLDTRINGGWTANQSHAISLAMLGRAGVLAAQPVAVNPGYWTPAMGRSAVQRAAGWLGMPYSWAGGSYSGPTFGSCSGDGANHVDCAFQGFDCSGLTLYAWAKYEPLAHFAATQLVQAGTFHPTLGELQPGDLMFFSGGGSVVSHVVMYAGNGRVIQASESGWPVRYSSLANVMSSHPRYFGATRPMSLGVQGAAPTVSSVSISRSATSGGATITIRGRHLDTASQVAFGAVGTYDFTIHSANAITVKIPANAAGPANVRVSNAWGESPVSARAVVTYYGKPTVQSLSLASTNTAGGSTVIITGKNFSPGTRVYFGATSATSVRVLSSTHVSVVAPPQAAGTVGVQVRTPYGSSNDLSFSYLFPPAAATPTSASPAATPTSAAPTSTSALTPTAALTPPAALTPTSAPPSAPTPPAI